MTHSELASLDGQFRRLISLPAEGDARLAAETFNDWLEWQHLSLLEAAALLARGEPVPDKAAGELRRGGAAAEARREVLQKAYPGEF